MMMLLHRLHRDESAVSVVETAFLLPVLIGMLISVLQVGLYLQAQNAVRGVGGEISRYMAVESQKRSALCPGQIEDRALGIAITAPYALKSDQIEIAVTDSAVQNIDRVRQMDVNVDYTVPNIMGFAKWGLLDIDYTRQIFIPTDLVRTCSSSDGTEDTSGTETTTTTTTAA